MSGYVMPSSSQSFYMLAQECAIRRCKRQCKAKFDDPICSQCRIYLRKYTQASEPALQMLMLHADSQAEQDRFDRRAHHVKYALLTALFVWLSIWGWKYDHRSVIVAPPPQETRKAMMDEPTNIKINNTLRHVALDFKNKVDVNGDKKINCIDAAVLFYKYYPDRNKVRIIRNFNYRSDFNHLFNAVKGEAGWYQIEPQTIYLGERLFGVSEVWGNRYDPQYNTDETERWSVYAK